MQNHNNYYINDSLSDKDRYLSTWGYIIGSPEAEQAWAEKCKFSGGIAPAVMPDLPGYESPVTGKWIEGRKARIEDLKATGCRPYEDGEVADYKRKKAREEKEIDKSFERAAAAAFFSLSEKKRRAFSR